MSTLARLVSPSYCYALSAAPASRGYKIADTCSVKQYPTTVAFLAADATGSEFADICSWLCYMLRGSRRWEDMQPQAFSDLPNLYVRQTCSVLQPWNSSCFSLSRESRAMSNCQVQSRYRTASCCWLRFLKAPPKFRTCW